MVGRYIDLGNPVADHPLNYGVSMWWLGLPTRGHGNYIYDLRGGIHSTIATGVKWRGESIYCTGGASADSTITANLAAADLTLEVYMTPLSWPGAFTTIFEKYTSVRELSVWGSSAGNLTLVTIGGTQAGNSDYIVLGSGKPVHMIVTRAGGVGDVYVNGKIGTRPTSVTGTTGAGGNTATFGRSLSGNTNPDIVYHSVRYSPRAVTASEAWRLYQQAAQGWPDLLRRFSRRVYSFGTVAGGGASTVPVKQHNYRRRRVA